MVELTPKLLDGIAQELMSDLMLYFNPDTGEHQCIPDEMSAYYDPSMDEFWQDAKDDIASWKRKILIENMPSFESFKMMERFIEAIDNTRLQKRLRDALEKKKPFRQFKYIIDDSDYRQAWFDFKELETQKWVKNQILEADLIENVDDDEDYIDIDDELDDFENTRKIEFDKIELKTAFGFRERKFTELDELMRVVTFTDDFVEKDWCEKGHRGYVLEGNFKIDFYGIEVSYKPGDGIWIDEDDKHKIVVPKGERVKLVLFEKNDSPF